MDNEAIANLCENKNYSPLTFACLNGFESIAKLLIKIATNVNLYHTQDSVHSVALVKIDIKTLYIF